MVTALTAIIGQKFCVSCVALLATFLSYLYKIFSTTKFELTLEIYSFDLRTFPSASSQPNIT